MSDTSRRKLLKSIAAGSGAIVAGKSLPESWSKPVVDSVMLPAHAQTSEETPEVPLGYSTNTFTGASIEPELLEFLIPTAHAGFDLGGAILVVVFEANLTSYNAWFQQSPASDPYAGNGSGTTETILDRQCEGANNEISLTLDSGPNAGGIGFSLSRGNDGFTGTLMQDDAPPSMPACER